MSEEKDATTTVKRSWLPSGLLLPMWVAGWISFGFGVVGLYEDREFLSLDSVLAVVGLVLVVVSFRVILNAARTSTEPESEENRKSILWKVTFGTLVSVWICHKVTDGEFTRWAGGAMVRLYRLLF